MVLLMSRDTPYTPPKADGKLQTKSPLPPCRAFVVQFHVEAKVAHGKVNGRVEHVVSGQAAHFTSVEELLTFIEQIFTTRS
jgi:hypothetical protein